MIQMDRPVALFANVSSSALAIFLQAAMRRSQSTGDIDGRGSDDGAAEYIQYIDEGVTFDYKDHYFPYL